MDVVRQVAFICITQGVFIKIGATIMEGVY